MIAPINSHSPSFQGKYVVNINENKHVKFLCNHLLDVSRKEHLSGLFARDYVELSATTTAQDVNLQKKLKDLSVKFFTVSK